MLVTTLDWSDYVGRIAIGRISSGGIKRGQQVALMQAGDSSMTGKVVGLHVFDKLGRTEVEEAEAGDIVAIVGLEQVEIGDTISDPIERVRCRASRSTSRRCTWSSPSTTPPWPAATGSTSPAGTCATA